MAASVFNRNSIRKFSAKPESPGMTFDVNVSRHAPNVAMAKSYRPPIAAATRRIFAWLPPLVAAAVRVLVGELGWSTILLCAGLPLVACGGIALCGREEHHRAAAGGLRTAFRAAAEIVKCGPYVVPVACVGVVASIVSIAAIRGIHHIMWWCDTSGPAALLSVVFSLAEHSSGRAMDVAVRLRFIS